MTGGLEPTESTDTRITVVVLGESGLRERIPCSSFEDAIAVVKAEVDATTVAKIENREGEIVFSSDDMNIGDWENEWIRSKRRLSVDVEDRDCPYDNVGCLVDDLCVQCKMDAVQNSV